MTSDREEVFAKVRDVLGDALGVDDDEVVATATLQGDLGAESIDFLDIVFRLEKEFTIKISKGELFPEDILSDPECVNGDTISSVGLERLKAAMPHVDLSSLEESPKVSAMPDLFTVGAMVNFVENKLAAV